MDPAGLTTSLRRGTLEFCVLALLAGGARYSVELVQTLGREAELATSEGTLYPLLSRLRSTGWVTTWWQESPTGPPRRYYELTPEGARALADFRARWTSFRDAVDRILETKHDDR